MATATDVGVALVNYFLSTGKFENLSAAKADTDIVPASAADEVPWQELTPFAGLQVRAVGVAEGDQPSCFIYVTKSSRKMEQSLPTDLGDVQIQIRKVGRMVVRPEAAMAATNEGKAYRRGPKIACGSSIAPAGAQFAGTLGALLTDRDGKLFALSNNHVIGGCNHTPLGQPITSPSGRDVMPGGPQMLQFAEVSHLVELRSGNMRYVPTQRTDAAIAQISNRNQVSSYQGNWYDTPTAVGLPEEDLRVMKVGRTTGRTEGFVESKVIGLMPLPYKDHRFTAVVNYANVWAVRNQDSGEPFALPGDSGSLVVSADGKRAIGLLFAVSTDGMTSFVTPLSDVLSDLGGGFSLTSGL